MRQEKLGPTILFAATLNGLVVVIGIGILIEVQKYQFQSAVQDVRDKMQQLQQERTVKPKFDEPLDRRKAQP